MRDLIKISDSAVAAIFAASLPGKIVQTLIGEALTLASLARITQTPLSLLHYHVSKCIKLGLVEIERIEPRAGRPLKHYRATARTFFVPSELLGKMPGDEMTRQLRDALDRNQALSVAGINFTHDGHRPCVFLIKDHATQATAVELWLDVGLDNADAVNLIEELKALLDRYRVRDNANEPRYLVHMAAVRAQVFRRTLK